MLSEEKLRESEAKYKQLFESVGDGLFIMKEHTIIDCNKRALELFQAKGYNRQTPLGTITKKSRIWRKIRR